MESARQYVSRLIEEMRGTEGCWVWPLSTTRAGYGQLARREGGVAVHYYAHRLAFEVSFGEIGDSLEVCHTCDNPSCFNPSHLFVGTHKENMQDSVKKGRNRVPVARYGVKHWSYRLPDRVPRGERVWNHKLSARDVVSIRESSDTGHDLAKKYGVSETVISNVRLGKSWKCVV